MVLFPTASEDGHELSDVKSSPATRVTETFPIDTAPAPMLFTVTVLNERLSRLTVPNETGFGVTLRHFCAELTFVAPIRP